MNRITNEIPSLRAGDRMSREEFLWRWEAHPEIKFAELVGGVVTMPAALGGDHGDADAHVTGWLTYYAAFTPGVQTSSNATTLMIDDAPQPDIHLRILPDFGGQTGREGKLISGAPELVVEVCDSSTSYDLKEKYELYQQANAREYLVVLLTENEVRWHRRGPAGFERFGPGKDGIHRSQCFPGLWLDAAALLQGDMQRVFAVVQEGLATPEHEALVQRLADRKAGG